MCHQASLIGTLVRQMIVVSDTTAVTTLLKAGMEGLLPALFDNVTIPQAVWNELMVFHAQLPNLCPASSGSPAGQLLPQTVSLGRGEAEAITLAKEIEADLLLSDDLKGRGIAASLNIKCTGLLGVLVRGKELGHINSVREAIGILETRGGIVIV
jgi:predicted nucleic acid-binding protein